MDLLERRSARVAREFVEQIVSYDLSSQRTVHIRTGWQPQASGVSTERLAKWLLQRLRFGMMEGTDICRVRHVEIIGIDAEFGLAGTSVWLHLAEAVLPGVEARVEADLRCGSGAASDTEEGPLAPIAQLRRS